MDAKIPPIQLLCSHLCKDKRKKQENGLINIIYYNFSFLFLYSEGKQKRKTQKEIITEK